MGIFNKFRNKNLDIPEEALGEMKKALHFLLCSGYFREEEILEQAPEIIGDICVIHELDIPEKNMIKNIVQKIGIVTGRREVTGNNYKKLRKVFDILNYEQIISIDFAGYNLSDGFEEIDKVFKYMRENNIQGKGYCFCHQKDIQRALDDRQQNLHLAFDSINNDEQLAMEIGKKIVYLLKKEGFQVNWNHRTDSKICIENFNWDKACDDEDYGVERAIRIIGFHLL